MPEAKKEMAPFKNLWEFLGLNYESPKGGIECIKKALGVIPAVRRGINRLMNL